MKVRRITDTSRLSEILVKNDNKMIIPVIDGAGNLIIGPEVLNDPAFVKIYKIIDEITEEIEYIPFTGKTVEEVSQKIQEFISQNKAIKIDQDGKIDYGGVKIPIKETKDIPDKDPKVDTKGDAKGIAAPQFRSMAVEDLPTEDKVMTEVAAGEPVVEEPKGVWGTMVSWGKSAVDWVKGLFS